MITQRRTIVLALSSALGLAVPAFGQEIGAGTNPAYGPGEGPGAGVPPGPTASSSEQSDRVLLRRLVRRVRRVDRDTADLTEQAMGEARRNGGSANPETKARLLSLRDERDRLFSRMLILSMRYGWAIPAVDERTPGGSDRQEAEDSVFGAVDAMLRKQFAAEASAIAMRVRLPVVSLAPASR